MGKEDFLNRKSTENPNAFQSPEQMRAHELRGSMDSLVSFLKRVPHAADGYVNKDVSPTAFVVGSRDITTLGMTVPFSRGLGTGLVTFRYNHQLYNTMLLPHGELTEDNFPLPNNLEIGLHMDNSTEPAVEKLLEQNPHLIDQLRTYFSVDKKGRVIKLSVLPPGLNDSRQSLSEDETIVQSPATVEDVDFAIAAANNLKRHTSSY